MQFSVLPVLSSCGPARVPSAYLSSLDRTALLAYALPALKLKRGRMKVAAVTVLALFLASAAAAQDWPSASLTRGTWELGPLVGAGTGLGKSDDTQFLYAGARAGLVLTGEHLPWLLRGDFEWAVDLMPVYTVFT